VPLLERERALETLDSSLEQTETQGGCVVLISGEAGLGKTTLLRAFAEREDARADFLWGWCEHLYTPRPLGPLRDMSAQLGEEIESLLDATQSPDRQELSSHTIFSAVVAQLQASRRTKVLVFEDIHWADRSTLDLIKFLGRRVKSMRVLLLLSFRDDEIESTHPLHQLLGDLPREQTARITLEPLNEQSVAHLASSQSSATIDARNVHRLTRGNPFYVTELLASGDATALPQNVTAAVLARAAQLDSSARRAFDLVSVLPGHAEMAMLDALLNADEHVGLTHAIDRGMLMLDRSRVGFRHELARRAAEQAIAPATRRQLHVEVLEWLRAQPMPESSRVAYHAAVIGNAQLVLETAPIAAREAANLGAHAEAAAHYARALEFVEQATAAQQADLLERWAYECGISGKIDAEVVAANRRALAIRERENNIEAMGRNLFWMGRMLWYMGKGDEASELAAAAVQTLQAEPDSKAYCLALSMRAQYLMLRAEPQQALEVGEQARKLAMRLEQLETLAHVLNTMGTARLMLADRSGQDLLDESLRISLANGFHEQAARAYTNGTWAAIEMRDFARAKDLARVGIVYDTEHDLDSWTPYLVGLFAGLRLSQGDIDEAVLLAERALAAPRITTVVRLPALTTIARAYSLRGDERALALLQQARALAEPTNEPMRIVRPVLLPLIEYHWLNDEIDAAREALAACARWRVENEWELGEIAAWHVRLGLARSAETTQYAQPFRAELTGDLPAACQLWQSIGAPFEEAFALLTSNAPDEAAINRILEIAESTGAHAIARRARALARAGGLRGVKRGVYTASKTNSFGLTAREAQMLALLADGKTNKEIAQLLSRSLRTVEHHISALYAKLGARNRLEALRIWGAQRNE
jgi:DNA-binding CsgD family transcriptional regulator